MRKLLLCLFGLGCLLLAVSANAQTPVISSTLSVSLTGDANSNGQTNPAEQLSYSLVITNTGLGSAIGVNLTMPAPANTTLVTGSLKTSALARPDSYTTLISGPLNATTVLTNDFGLPTKTVLSFGPLATPGSVVANGTNTASSDQGATVVMQTNGSFTYTPTGSFVGYDKFGYTATTTTPPDDAATVTVGVGTPVTAQANFYTITGNVTNTQLAPGVLGNDTGDQRVVTAVNGNTANVGVAVTTAQSGTVNVGADGSFLYDPPAGYEGPDSFTYTANNGLNLPSSAVVSLTIVGMIWFVNSGAGSNGIGTLAKPFSSLASFQSVNNGNDNNPAAGDNIFLYTGSYSGGVTLLNNQKLIGQGAKASLASITGITLAPGSAALPPTNLADPNLTNASGNSVSLASGNTVRGLTIGSSSVNALVGSSFGSLTVADLTINTAGRALALTTGAVSGSFDSVSSTAGSNNIALTTVTGSFSINAGVLSGASATSFSINGGSVSVTYSGNLSQANNAPMVNVVGGHSGTLLFQTGTLNATNGTGLQFDNADGTYTFNGTTTLNGSDAGIDIVNGSGGTFTFGSNTSITNPSGIAYREDSSTPGVSYNGTIIKTNNANIAVDINAKSGGTTVFGGAITASTTTSNAIDLTNTGGTVSFTGGSLTLTTTSGIGFNATGGFTVNVTGSGNRISSGTGTALNVSNTTIGASGLTFHSISANGGSSGLVLNNTGSSGGLTITGDGASDPNNNTKGRTTAKSGGGTLALGSGGTINNSSGISISLTNTGPVFLYNMVLQNGSTDGVKATSVASMLVDNTKISGFANGHGLQASSSTNIHFQHAEIGNNATTLATGGSDIWNVQLDNVTGSTTIKNSFFNISLESVFNVKNNSGILSLTSTNSNFSGATAGTGLGLFPYGSATIIAHIQNSTIATNSARGIQSATETGGSGSLSLNVNNCTFINNYVSIDNAHGSSGTNSFSVTDNNCQTNVASSAMAISINRLGSPTFSNFGLFSGTVSRNIIGTAGIADSGSSAGDGITVKTNGNGGSIRISILNNTIREYGQHGIGLFARDATTGHLFEARVEGNNIANGKASLSLDGINVTLGALNTDVLTICLNILSNTVANAVRNGIRVRSSGLPAANATLTLPAYDTTGAAYFANRNPAATGAGGNTSFSNSSGTTTAGNCTTP
ncbi:Ig-like domain-containing protein [Spirosoma sp. BT702]|uniref:Ig-like domain-containing protein n=1 Tax=Spirosoma profusum TaxID=2771354 RepID=A0A926Y4I5_9BACT|nr:Ig-like domain-containing protein [Spirosoma profusum]MBD2704598.1 Ig-like domain-containing protein [Spirosoma profusum]